VLCPSAIQNKKPPKREGVSLAHVAALPLVWIAALVAPLRTRGYVRSGFNACWTEDCIAFRVGASGFLQCSNFKHCPIFRQYMLFNDLAAFLGRYYFSSSPKASGSKACPSKKLSAPRIKRPCMLPTPVGSLIPPSSFELAPGKVAPKGFSAAR
jgi:hypothetical protein